MTPPASKKMPYTKAVAQVLRASREPLTLDELLAGVAELRSIDSRNPKNTMRNAVKDLQQATSLPGRPAQYVWWPHRLPGCVFRQPLSPATLETGRLRLTSEVRQAIWPDFYERDEPEPRFHFALEDGDTFVTPIEHLLRGEAAWGWKQCDALASWLRKRHATPHDELGVTIHDAETRRFRLQLLPRAERDDEAIAARNRALLDQLEVVLPQRALFAITSSVHPRLFVSQVYRHPLPPDPIVAVVRQDPRFLMHYTSAYNLTQKYVNELEHANLPREPFGAPRPRGDRTKARTDKAKQAWSEYLFDRGMEWLWSGYEHQGEAYHRETVRLDPLHTDAWVHIGNRLHEQGHSKDALALYQKAQETAEATNIGVPEEYPHPFWSDIDTRPFMRALHGQGLCHWRLGQIDQAQAIFERMMRLNPDDHQGVRFLLPDLQLGLTLDESITQQEDLITIQ